MHEVRLHPVARAEGPSDADGERDEGELYTNEQALVCLSNKKKSTRADVDHFIAKWRVTVFFSNCFRQIYLAI